MQIYNKRLQISVTAAEGDERDTLDVFAYLKPVEQFEMNMVKKGPLASYELSDALLYRPR
ncbi:hypothetical protein [Herbaspirillum lusitanum]|uniref:hypothetical protein n=1 Tax=Herbaspirillum lusitanum TaxID=213312 RepID=UPI00036FF02C|nr:hypothetical protein [Herbaspirillum lusitanum]